MKFLFGVVVGIVIATVGVTGVANMIDHQVNKLQHTIKENVI
jgi:hypothetical protein